MAMRDWVTKDFSWKLFSLFLALALWLTVHKIYEEPGAASGLVVGNTVTFGNLPVLVVSAASDVRDFRVAPATVAVKVSGPPEVMADLQANQIHAMVDLTDVQSARDLRRRVDISTPPRVTLVSVDPPKVGVIVPPPPDKKP
ncbi:MAG: CdaR family protein [Verrucomicrobiota bacterium]|jgi:YbbR domain-containing protein